MKEIILSLLTIPGLLILIYLYGIFSYGYKRKIKIFSTCLFIMFIISLPFFGKIFSYPLIGFPKLFLSSDLKDILATDSVTALAVHEKFIVVGKVYMKLRKDIQNQITCN